MGEIYMSYTIAAVLLVTAAATTTATTNNLHLSGNN